MGVVGGAEAADVTAGVVKSDLDATGRGGSGLAGGASGSDQDCGAEGSGRPSGAGAGAGRT
jgi:hypothetical protein